MLGLYPLKTFLVPRVAIVCSIALASAACTAKSGASQCPDPAMVAPASVGGAAEVKSLSGMLSGPDNENAITESAQELHRRDHTLGADQITDILIAAECEGQSARTGSTYDRAQRTRRISKQVDAVMATVPAGSV